MRAILFGANQPSCIIRWSSPTIYQRKEDFSPDPTQTERYTQHFPRIQWHLLPPPDREKKKEQIPTKRSLQQAEKHDVDLSKTGQGVPTSNPFTIPERAEEAKQSRGKLQQLFLRAQQAPKMPKKVRSFHSLYSFPFFDGTPLPRFPLPNRRSVASVVSQPSDWKGERASEGPGFLRVSHVGQIFWPTSSIACTRRRPVALAVRCR